MPRMDGKEALARTREMKRFAGIPAILFTTSSQPRDKEFSEKYSAGFITKTIDITQMDIIASSFKNIAPMKSKKEIVR